MPRARAWAPLTVGHRAALGNAQPERQGYLEGPSPVPFHVAFLEPECKTEPLICTSRHWMKCFQRITSLILTTTHFTGEKTEAQKIQGKLNLPSWQNPKTFSFLKSMLEPGLPTPSVVLFPFPYQEALDQGGGISHLLGYLQSLLYPHQSIMLYPSTLNSKQLFLNSLIFVTCVRKMGLSLPAHMDIVRTNKKTNKPSAQGLLQSLSRKNCRLLQRGCPEPAQSRLFSYSLSPFSVSQPQRRKVV